MRNICWPTVARRDGYINNLQTNKSSTVHRNSSLTNILSAPANHYWKQQKYSILRWCIVKIGRLSQQIFIRYMRWQNFCRLLLLLLKKKLFIYNSGSSFFGAPKHGRVTNKCFKEYRGLLLVK